MITGRYNERFAPERRNGRPFYHLLPRWAARPPVVEAPLVVTAPVVLPANHD
jgi:hypothetical protein